MFTEVVCRQTKKFGCQLGGEQTQLAFLLQREDAEIRGLRVCGRPHGAKGLTL